LPVIPFRPAVMAALALVFAVPGHADVKDGVDAWSRGDYAAAVRQWQGPANAGDADAQFNLAQAYKLGRGVNQDLTKAEQLFVKAAAQGHLQAADNLGLLMFQRGERAGAMPYIKAASGRGDPRAHYVLGLAHFNGDGVEKDWERAYALVSLAQQAGLPQAHLPSPRWTSTSRSNSASAASSLPPQSQRRRSRPGARRWLPSISTQTADGPRWPCDPSIPGRHRPRTIPAQTIRRAALLRWRRS
jgi:TPR repeat protein